MQNAPAGLAHAVQGTFHLLRFWLHDCLTAMGGRTGTTNQTISLLSQARCPQVTKQRNFANGQPGSCEPGSLMRCRPSSYEQPIRREAASVLRTRAPVWRISWRLHSTRATSTRQRVLCRTLRLHFPPSPYSSAGRFFRLGVTGSSGGAENES
jgi:hypothetical protein